MRLTLYALLGNRPLEQEMADKLESVVSSADFVAMFKMDPTLARIALSLASMQAGNLRDSTSRQRLIDAFIGIGRSLSQFDSNEPQFEPGAGKSSDALEEVGPVLLEIALNLSLAVGDSKSPPAWRGRSSKSSPVEIASGQNCIRPKSPPVKIASVSFCFVGPHKLRNLEMIVVFRGTPPVYVI